MIGVGRVQALPSDFLPPTARLRQISREPTKILLVAARRAPDLASRLTAVIDTYKTRFHQQSVGIITRGPNFRLPLYGSRYVI